VATAVDYSETEEKKSETCPRCGKKIGLFEAADHDSLCRDCYWNERV
jgi:NMD protein affecting ribosome stability and mRNA decay